MAFGVTKEERAARDAKRAEEGRVRWSYDCKGRVLKLSKSGLIVVPYQAVGDGHWYAVVVDPGEKPECQKSYPRGGYDLLIFKDDVETAIEVELKDTE